MLGTGPERPRARSEAVPTPRACFFVVGMFVVCLLLVCKNLFFVFCNDHLALVGGLILVVWTLGVTSSFGARNWGSHPHQ